MQTVYIDNKNKTNNFDILREYLHQIDDIKVPNYFCYFFKSENKDSMFKKKDDLIINLGVFIYKNFYNHEALKLFYQDLESGLLPSFRMLDSVEEPETVLEKLQMDLNAERYLRRLLDRIKIEETT